MNIVVDETDAPCTSRTKDMWLGGYAWKTEIVSFMLFFFALLLVVLSVACKLDDNTKTVFLTLVSGVIGNFMTFSIKRREDGVVQSDENH